MRKLGIYLIMLTVRLSGRRCNGSKVKKSNVCSKKFVRMEEMEKHTRDVHADMLLEKLRPKI
jgi:hypothetical protein